MLDLSVIVPVKDEEGNVPELVSRFSNVIHELKLSYEIIFITDKNRDNTFSVLKSLHKKDDRVKILKLSNSFGQHVAVIAGLHFCRGNAVVIMDGDLQDYPEDIPKLYNKMKEGYDVVYSEKERKDESSIRNFFSKSFLKLLNKLSDYEIDYNTSMFRIMSRRVVKAICNFKESEPSLTGLVSLTGFPTTKVKVTSGKRKSGETKYNFLRQVNVALSFLLSFSTKPLRISYIVGFIIAGLSFIQLIIILIEKLLFNIGLLGLPTLIALVAFLGGVQLFFLGVIGEYIARIFIESKNRPLYILEEKIGEFE